MYQLILTLNCGTFEVFKVKMDEWFKRKMLNNVLHGNMNMALINE